MRASTLLAPVQAAEIAAEIGRGRHAKPPFSPCPGPLPVHVRVTSESHPSRRLGQCPNARISEPLGSPVRAARSPRPGARAADPGDVQSLCAGSGRAGLVQHRDLEAALVPLERAAAADSDPAAHAAQVRALAPSPTHLSHSFTLTHADGGAEQVAATADLLSELSILPEGRAVLRDLDALRPLVCIVLNADADAADAAAASPAGSGSHANSAAAAAAAAAQRVRGRSGHIITGGEKLAGG
jgi:hypothetical protein